MNEFDDPELGRSLGRLSGAFPDDVTAFSQVQGKVRQARRRRAAGLAGSATLVAAFSVGAFALSGQRSAQRLEPADQSEVNDNDGDAAEFTTTITPTTLVITTSTELPTTTESTIAEPSTSEAIEGGDDQGPTNTEGQAPAVTVPRNSGGSPTPTQTPTQTPTTAKSNPKPPKATVPPTVPPTVPQTAPPVTPAPTTSAPDGDGDHGGGGGGSFTPSTQSFSGIGGTITVSIDSDGHVRMLSYTANAGYSAEDIRSGSSRVSIRFRSGGLSTKIRVDVVGDGMQPTVEEES